MNGRNRDTLMSDDKKSNSNSVVIFWAVVFIVFFYLYFSAPSCVVLTKNGSYGNITCPEGVGPGRHVIVVP